MDSNHDVIVIAGELNDRAILNHLEMILCIPS